MRLVTRNRDDDCGVCCLASVAGVEWHDAARAIFGENYDCRDWFATSPRIVALGARRLGVGVRVQRSERCFVVFRRDWRTIVRKEDEIALVKSFRKGPEREEWHWLLYDGKKIIDPQKQVVWQPEACPYIPCSYMVLVPPTRNDIG